MESVEMKGEIENRREREQKLIAIELILVGTIHRNRMSELERTLEIIYSNQFIC